MCDHRNRKGRVKLIEISCQKVLGSNSIFYSGSYYAKPDGRRFYLSPSPQPS